MKRLGLCPYRTKFYTCSAACFVLFVGPFTPVFLGSYDWTSFIKRPRVLSELSGMMLTMSFSDKGAVDTSACRDLLDIMIVGSFSCAMLEAQQAWRFTGSSSYSPVPLGSSPFTLTTTVVGISHVQTRGQVRRLGMDIETFACLACSWAKVQRLKNHSHRNPVCLPEDPCHIVQSGAVISFSLHSREDDLGICSLKCLRGTRGL